MGTLNRAKWAPHKGATLATAGKYPAATQLDQELEKRGHRFARYAEDFGVLVKSQRVDERVMQSITRYLEVTLKLKVNPAKSKVAAIEVNALS